MVRVTVHTDTGNTFDVALDNHTHWKSEVEEIARTGAWEIHPAWRIFHPARRIVRIEVEDLPRNR